MAKKNKKDTIDNIVKRNLPEEGNLSDLLYYARRDDMKIGNIIEDYLGYSRKKGSENAYKLCYPHFLPYLPITLLNWLNPLPVPVPLPLPLPFCFLGNRGARERGSEGAREHRNMGLMNGIGIINGLGLINGKGSINDQGLIYRSFLFQLLLPAQYQPQRYHYKQDRYNNPHYIFS